MSVLPRAASWMWMVVAGQTLLITLSYGAKPELLAAVLLPALLLAVPFLRWTLPNCGRVGGGPQGRVHDFAEDAARQQTAAKSEVFRAYPAQQCALEQERERIARDLHDDLGQTLTALKLDLGLLLESQPPLDATRRQRLERAISTADLGLAQIISVVGNLRPSLLKHAGFLDAARWCVEEADQRLQAEVRFKVGDGADFSLPEDTAVALYRMLQECLTNVAKHADATRVEVSYQVVAGRVILCIKDNGCGFDLERVQKKKGYGLLGMRERAEALGGYCTAETGPNLGCSITIVVPLHHEKNSTASGR